MTIEMQKEKDFVSAIGEIAIDMPLARIVQLYEFALFLKSHPLPAEESIEEIIADEALWEKQFADTSDEQFSTLVASVEAEIDEEGTQPMFDESGSFIEQR